MKKKLILMGHFDGYGGAQTAFKKLVDFADEDKFEFGIIPISDFPERVFEHYHRIPVLGVVPYKPSSFISKTAKILQLIRICIKARLYNADVFITVGLNNSSNLIAGGLNKKCFKIAQDFIAHRLSTDSIWKKSKKTFDGIAVQAPAMLSYWKQSVPGITGINWLPCFPEPPVKNVKQVAIDQTRDTVQICYFGRLAANKGLDLLINALKDPRVPHGISVDLWGTGAELEYLKQLVSSLNLTHRVRFMGVYPEGIAGAKKMASYDCLILCSTGSEGLPLILLEAMAYGIPFMATNVGAIKDCCVNNADAILIEPNENAIAEGLAKVYQQILNKTFESDRQINYYTENFSYPIMKKQWEKCLQNPSDFFYSNS